MQKEQEELKAAMLEMAKACKAIHCRDCFMHQNYKDGVFCGVQDYAPVNFPEAIEAATKGEKE